MTKSGSDNLHLLSKKFFSVLIACFMVIGLSACASAGEPGGADAAGGQTGIGASQVPVQTGGDAANAGNSGEAAQTGEDAQPTGAIQSDGTDSGSGILVVYFSRTGEQYSVGVVEKGNTEIVADMIIEETGADRFKIVPAEDYYPYTYDELTDIAKQEQNERARPAYAGEVPDLSRYSTIYIGSPVWWGDWPMIMYTFFEENADALAGKTLLPFSTHAGSGLAGFDQKLASACPDSTVGTGLAIPGKDAQNDPDSVRSAVQDWIAAQ